MNLKKILYIIIGCIGVVLGAIGTVLPLLPTFPFLCLSLFCFARSSDRLHDWFTSTKLYKQNLESFVKGGGMTRKTKVCIMLTVTLLMSIGFILMHRIVLARIILVCVWAFHILYFSFGIKTLQSTK